MTSNVDFTNILPITGNSPITLNFLLSTIPGDNLAKVYFDFGDSTNSTIFWHASTAPASAVSSLPISADPGNIKNFTIQKTYTRNSIVEPTLFTVSVSAYDTINFTATAYEIEISNIQVPSTSAQFAGNMILLDSKYIGFNKMMLIFEEQSSGKIYSVIADPNFTEDIVNDTEYQALCSLYH